MKYSGWTIVFCLFLGACTPPVQQYSDYEAAEVSGMVLMEDAKAVSGNYLVMEEEGSVSWQVSVPDSGYYNIAFRYRAFGGSKAQVLIKNEKKIPVGFSMAEDWQVFSQPFFLDKGENRVGLASGWGFMDIDVLRISPCSPEPGISPLTQTIYLNHPRPLRFKLDNYREPVRAVSIDGREVEYHLRDYPYQERAVWLELLPDALQSLAGGEHSLRVELESGPVECLIRVEAVVPPHALTILAPDVEHGASVLVKLPTGRYLLIDTGKKWVRDSILFPMFRNNGIDTIHTLILTHYHPDHDSEDRGETLMKEFHTEKLLDYRSLQTGEWLSYDSVTVRILNSYEQGTDENTRSMAFTLTYKGFVYNHGGDTYAVNQQRMLEAFGDENRAQVFFANHHFHGSVLPAYIRLVNPDLVLLQAQEAVYARSAYMDDYLEQSLGPLNEARDVPVETLFALELGASVISVVDGDTWWHATYMDQQGAIFPEFQQGK